MLADIHSNLEAFEAVLQDLEARGGAEKILCLGDIVGYGPDPRECLNLVRQQAVYSVAGNHDLATAGKLNASAFNPEALAACRWTAGALSPDEARFLADLPLTLRLSELTLVHGSPRDPVWEYVLSTQVAKANFAAFETAVCLIGHSHSPALFVLDAPDSCRLLDLPGRLNLETGKRYIINCGSVGQPRDGDPRASFAIIDTSLQALFHYRVTYNYRLTQEKILDAGLPARLASRLSLGW